MCFWNEQNLLAQLLPFLSGETDSKALTGEYQQLLDHLSYFVQLTAEEVLLLRLHYQSGLTINEITQLLPFLTEDEVEKRLKKALIHLQGTFQHQGLL